MISRFHDGGALLNALLHTGILGKVWPAERVILGLRVCWLLHSDLLDHVDVLLENSTQASIHGISAEQVCTTLVRMRGNFMTAKWKALGNAGAVRLLYGMQAAAASGFGEKLVHLDLTNSWMQSSGALLLSGVLKNCKALTHLNLCGCWIGVGGAGAMADKLEAMQLLVLRDNQLGDVGMTKVAAGLQNCSQLTHLDVGENDIGDEGAIRLGECVGCALEHLCARLNWIGSEGMGALAESLRRCSALRHLDLSGNDVGAEGVKRLAGALTSLTVLSHMDLSNNDLKDDGATNIAEGLSHFSSLTFLDLSQNRIGGEGAMSLVHSFGARGQPAALRLKSNVVDDAAASRLTAFLRQHPAQIQLDLSSNLMSYHSVGAAPT